MEANEILEQYKKLAKETRSVIKVVVASIKFAFDPHSPATNMYYYGINGSIKASGAEELFTTCLAIQRGE